MVGESPIIKNSFLAFPPRGYRLRSLPREPAGGARGAAAQPALVNGTGRELPSTEHLLCALSLPRAARRRTSHRQEGQEGGGIGGTVMCPEMNVDVKADFLLQAGPDLGPGGGGPCILLLH